MKEKKATISAKGASTKQWADLILELNLRKKAWRRYGVNNYRERTRKKVGRHKKNLNKQEKRQKKKKYRGQGR